MRRDKLHPGGFYCENTLANRFFFLYTEARMIVFSVEVDHGKNNRDRSAGL